jgi:hypothetical protein
VLLVHRGSVRAPGRSPAIRPHIRTRLDGISPEDIIGSNAGSTAGNATNDESDDRNEQIDRERAG